MDHRAQEHAFGLVLSGVALVCLEILAVAGNGPRSRRGSWRCYWLAFVLYVCALWSKTTTLPLPAVILLLVWWKRGRLAWRDVWPLGLFLAAGVAMGLMTLHTEHHLGAAGPGWALSWSQRCLLAGYDVWFYLGKLLWPHPLIFVYPRWTIQTSAWEAYVPVLALGAGLAITWWRRKAWGRAPLAALLYFIALLFLALGFFNVYYFRYSYVADHFQYLAGMGPLALAAAGITRRLECFPRIICALNPRTVVGTRCGASKADQQVGPTGGARCGASEADRQVGPTEVARWLQPVFCGALLLTLGVLTWRQSRMYADTENFWRRIIEQNPAAWMAQNNLGNFLLQQGRVEEAITHFHRAAEIKPDDPEIYNNLGNALLQEGRTDDAILELQKALALQPGYAKADCNLASALLQEGRVDEAIGRCQELLAVQPDNSQARCILGAALLRKGQTDAAIGQYEKALALQPDDAEAHYDLGTALLEERQMDEAIAHFQTAIALQPDYADACDNLGSALLQQGRVEQAIRAYRKALVLQPGRAETCNNLGNALAQNGQTDEAITQFQRALALRPDYAQAHYNLGNALLKKGRVGDAISQFQQALALQPGDADAHYNLGAAFLQNKQEDEAIPQFQAALALQPEFVEAQTALARQAWQLATSPDPSLRNGPRAVELAQQADRLSGGANPVMAGTLAAADAEAGRFPEAVANAQRAVRLAEGQNNAALAAALEAQLKLYQAGSPFHQAAPR